MFKAKVDTPKLISVSKRRYVETKHSGKQKFWFLETDFSETWVYDTLTLTLSLRNRKSIRKLSERVSLALKITANQCESVFKKPVS